MQIVEVKNNLVKASYDTSSEIPVLSGFAIIKDEKISFIGQIIYLESISGISTAAIKLLFTFNDEGIISAYNGAIPNSNCPIELISTQELLAIIPIEYPIFMGELAGQDIKLNIDKKSLDEKLLVCCENEENKNILNKNLINQLYISGNRVILFDIKGTYDFENKIVAGKDFKLPLNYDTINFIYEKGLDEVGLETKAKIQEVFLEVQNYVKSLPEGFLPFETFKAVVDEQYEDDNSPELLLLKNKLLKYHDEGIFAQVETEFSINLNDKTLKVIDLSNLDAKFQREFISYIYKLAEDTEFNIYSFVEVNDENSDKKLLKKFFTAKTVKSIINCNYTYKYLKELKQLSKNLILFAPIQQQNDFATYNVFLRKLNPNEFIMYGTALHSMPLIVKLEEIKFDKIENIEQENLTSQEIPVESENEEDNDDTEIQKTTENFEEPQDFNVEQVPDEFSEDDLDFIENNFPENDETENLVNTSSDIDYQEIQEEAEIFPEPEQVQEELPQELEEEPTIESEQNETFSQEFEEAHPSLEIKEAPPVDILPASMASTPIVPIYSADVEIGR